MKKVMCGGTTYKFLNNAPYKKNNNKYWEATAIDDDGYKVIIQWMFDDEQNEKPKDWSNPCGIIFTPPMSA